MCDIRNTISSPIKGICCAGCVLHDESVATAIFNHKSSPAVDTIHQGPSFFTDKLMYNSRYLASSEFCNASKEFSPVVLYNAININQSVMIEEEINMKGVPIQSIDAIIDKDLPQLRVYSELKYGTSAPGNKTVFVIPVETGPARAAAPTVGFHCKPEVVETIYTKLKEAPDILAALSIKDGNVRVSVKSPDGRARFIVAAANSREDIRNIRCEHVIYGLHGRTKKKKRSIRKGFTRETQSKQPSKEPPPSHLPPPVVVDGVETDDGYGPFGIAMFDRAEQQQPLVEEICRGDCPFHESFVAYCERRFSAPAAPPAVADDVGQTIPHYHEIYMPMEAFCSKRAHHEYLFS